MAGFSDTSVRERSQCRYALSNHGQGDTGRFQGEPLDYWVTGFGTGGTLKGVARVLAKERPDTKIVVCEPDDAPMLSSGIEQQRKPGWVGSGEPPLCGSRILARLEPRLHPEADSGRRGDERHQPAHKNQNAEAMRCSIDLARKEGISSALAPARRSRQPCKSVQTLQRNRRSCACCRTPESAIEHSALRRRFH